MIALNLFNFQPTEYVALYLIKTTCIVCQIHNHIGQKVDKTNTCKIDEIRHYLN